MKRKQHIIPSIQSQWRDLSIVELRNKSFLHYKNNIAGKSVKNFSTGYIIHLTVKGGRKLLKGGNIYNSKAEIVRILLEVIRFAVFNNWGERKTTDKSYVIGYLNFKCKVRFDSRIIHLRIAIQLRKDGKLYYNHEVNKWKK
jgi:hypothetical protein